MVEYDTQSGGLRAAQALGGMNKDGTYLLVCYAGKPVQELGGLGSISQVLEQRGNRDAGTSENPLAAHALGITLNRCA